MYKLFMALRYLRSHRIIYFSIAGVALGIAVIVIVMSVMGGFSRDIRERIRGMQSHLIVTSISRDILILDYNPLADRIAKIPHVKGAAPRIEYVAWMGSRGVERDIHLVGIDPTRDRAASQVKLFFDRGGKKKFDFGYDGGESPAKPGIVVGTELARMAPIGDMPGLLTVRRGVKTHVCNSNFEVVGKFDSGMVEYDSTFVFVELTSAQKFLRLTCVPPCTGDPHLPDCQPPAVNYIAVMLDDYQANAESVRSAIVNLLHTDHPCRTPELHKYGSCGLYSIQTWEEQKANLLRAVSIEKGIQVVILFCIIVVASFNIIGFYTLMVKAKGREIGILRALGASRGGIAQIFLTSGLLCGLFGSAIGIIAGLKISYKLNDVAEAVEQTSKAVAAWARHNPDSGLVKNGSALAVGLVAALLGIAVGSIVLRKKRGVAFSFRILFGSLAITLISMAGFELLLDGFQVVGAGDSLLPELMRILRWVLTPALVVAYIAGLTGARRGVIWVARGVVWTALLALLVRFAGSDATWEVFFGELLFDILGSLGALLLARAMVQFPENYVLPVLSYIGVLVVAAVLVLVAMFVQTPPGPEWAGLNLFPKDVYYLDRIPAEVSYPSILFVVALTMIASIAATLYPAFRAAVYDPIEAIRRE